MTYTPLEIAEQLNGELLKKMMRTLGIGKDLTRKAEMAAAIEGYFRKDPKAFLTHCSTVESHVLAEAAHGDGQVEPSTFFGKYGCGFPSCPDSYRAKTVSPYHALVALDEDGDIRMCPEVATALRLLLPAPKKVTMATVDSLPEAHHGRPVMVYAGEEAVFAELRQVLALARSGQIAVTPKKGTPTESTVKKIGEALAAPDFALDAPPEEQSQWYDEPGPVRAFAWGVLVQACGWCKAKGSKLELTKNGIAMLSDLTPINFREGVCRFFDDEEYDELQRINHIRGQSGNARRSLVSVAERKSDVSLAMEEWPIGAWMAFDELFRFQLAAGHSFHVTRNPWDLYFCEKQYGSLGYSGANSGLEKQYLRALIMESLATLGLVDIAYTRPHGLWPDFSGWWGTDELPFCGRYDGLLFVKLNALGAFCLNRSEDYKASIPKRAAWCHILPNLEVAVTGATVSAADVCTLGLFAERMGDRVWRIDRDSVLAYLDKSGSMAELRQIIQSIAENELPANVGVFLDDIERRAVSIRSMEKAWLVDCGEAATAAAIAADAGAGKVCVRAGETCVAVKEKNERAFRSALKKAGYVLPL